MKTWNLGCKKKNICGLTKQNVELPEAAEQGDNIGIYSPGLLESSSRSAGRRPHRGLPPSRLLPELLPLSDITHRWRQTESFFLSPSGKNSLKFCDVYERGGGVFFTFYFLPSLNILKSIYIHCPLPPPHSSPLSQWHIIFRSRILSKPIKNELPLANWFSIIHVTYINNICGTIPHNTIKRCKYRVFQINQQRE